MRFKLNLLTLAMLTFAAGSAQANILTFSGDSTGASTFNRPVEDLSALSLVGTATPYSAYAFTVSTAGTYSFVSTARFDNFVLLYEGAFTSASPLQSALTANDDLVTSDTSGFGAELSAGTSYVLVTTGYDNDAYGAFTNTIGGPGLIAAVPEVDSYLLMLSGLLAVAGIAGRRKVR
ncbi:MAG: hypothetical protein ACK4JA_07960 [Parazoarcus communis]